MIVSIHSCLFIYFEISFKHNQIYPMYEEVKVKYKCLLRKMTNRREVMKYLRRGFIIII